MSWLGDLFIGGEKERGEELDRQIRELNAQKEAKGVITAGQRAAYDAALESESSAIWDKQVNDDFSAGIDEGYQNVTGGIKSAINAPARFIWDAIPLWVWGAALVFGLWQIGRVRRWVSALLT